MAEPPRPLTPPDDDLRPPAGLVGKGPYRYARWDGRQRLPELGADELLDAISDDLLVDGDLASALGRLFGRGLRGAPDGTGRLAGLAELRRRLARQRDEVLSRYQLGGVLDGLRQELEEIVATERRGLERRLAVAVDAMGGDRACSPG